MARRLKVYRTRLGFFDTVVAAPSQSEALKAWGVHQNLFAAGDADVTDEPAVVKAALGHPGAPLMRAAGSSDPFSLEPRAPDVPAPSARPTAKRPARHAAKPDEPRPAPPPPDRSALDDAERRLARVSERQAAEAAELDRRRASLEEDAAAARRRWAKERREAEREAARASRAFERAGGKPR